VFKKIAAMLVVGVTLVSCGENWDEEKEDIHNDVPSTPQVYFEQILEKEQIVKEAFLAMVNEHDVLIFTLTGKLTTPQFGPVYERRYSSRWKERFCEPRDPGCRMCNLLQKLMYCYDITEKGHCNLKYRDYNGRIEDTIFFTDSIDESKIRIKIGNNLYPLGKITYHEGMAIKTEFVVSKEMLQESNELSLVVVPDPNQGNIKTGFLGYGSCQGHGKRGFSHGGSTASATHANQIQREFLVSASFKRIKQ